jgi:hypothetical protein
MIPHRGRSFDFRPNLRRGLAFRKSRARLLILSKSSRSYNARVHRFTADGDLRMSWGEGARRRRATSTCPSLIVHRDGRVYVCDRENNRIQVFSADGQFITMWTDLRRPLDISMDREGILSISEGGVDGLSPRISLMDTQANVVARWDSPSAHGSWVDAHGDIYLALGARKRVDKYVRQG